MAFVEHLLTSLSAMTDAVRTMVSQGEEKALVSRLEKELASRRDQPDTIFTFDRLKTLTDAGSAAALTLAVRYLIEKGKMKTVVRVESPSNRGGIRDFPTLDEVPKEIYDWRAGKDVEVTRDMVNVLFAPTETAATGTRRGEAAAGSTAITDDASGEGSASSIKG
jgi:hypothetical protein